MTTTLTPAARTWLKRLADGNDGTRITVGPRDQLIAAGLIEATRDGFTLTDRTED
jgi:hypothetical protein